MSISVRAFTSTFLTLGLSTSNRIQGRFVGSSDPVAVKSSTFKFSSKHLLYGRLRPYLNKVMAPDFEGHCSTEIFPIKPMPGLSQISSITGFCEMRPWRRSTPPARARMPRANMNAVLGLNCTAAPSRTAPDHRHSRKVVKGIVTATANAEKNLRNAHALFDSHLRSVFSRPPSGWLDTTIGQGIRFIDYRGKTPEKTTSGLRLITAKNVKMGYLQEFPKEFVAPKSYDSWMTRGIPRQGDVLFTTEAPLANVAT